MRILFIGISYLCLAILGFFTLKEFKRKDPMTVVLRRVMCHSMVTIIAYSLLLMADTASLGNLALLVYAISIDGLVFSLIAYAAEYTYRPKAKKVFGRIFIPLILVDAVVLAFVAIRGVLVRFKSVEVLYSKPILVPVHWNIVYMIHLVFVYVMIMISLILLISKGVIAVDWARKKYYSVAVIIMAMSMLNALFMIRGYAFDPSILIFAVGAFTLNYYTVVYTPRFVSGAVTKYVVEELDEMIACFDADNKMSYCNQIVKDAIGTEAASVLERQFKSWLDEYPVFKEWGSEVHEWPSVLDINGEKRHVQIFFRKHFDEFGNYVGCYFKLTDVTDIKKEFEERQESMKLDTLTGVNRREYFFKEVRQILDENQDKKCSIVCTNIADFKIYNSVFGEEQGNVVLCRLAERLVQMKHSLLAYGRISGDVFGAIVLKDEFKEAPIAKAIEELQKEFSTSQYKLKVQVGIYEINDISEPVSAMCEKANLVMKAGKRSLNQTFFYFKEKEISGLLGAKQVISRFDDALEKGQFLMYLQPQVTADGDVLGCEALCRWLDDGNQLIPLYSFIPVLEENGLITKLDKYIWDQAAKKLSEWKSVGREDLYISVNISGKDFYYVDVFDEFTGLVERYNLNPRRLKLEITETAIVQDMEAMIKLVKKLREYGFEVEIDDFGSGYSSLGMLKDLEVDVLKLDMSFLRKASQSKEERMWIIMNQMANMADALGMGTVVEGVEDLEQVERLSEMGCRVFQGYYFAQPEPVSNFEFRAKIMC